MERKYFAVILAVALAACTPTGDPPEGATSDGPEAAGALLPSCEGLLGPGDLGNYFFEQVDGVELLPPQPNWGPPASQISDPEVQSVLQQADAIDSCTWGVPAVMHSSRS